MSRAFILILLLDLILQEYLRFVGNGIMNSGVAFGLLHDSKWLGLAIFCILVVMYKKLPKDLGIQMILGGGITNLFVRLVHGSVWDYINLGIIKVNMSDIIVCTGLALFLYETTRDHFSK